jgi:hypothetical protein
MLKKVMIIGAVIAAATVESSAQYCLTCSLTTNSASANALINKPVTGTNLNGRVVGIKF